MKILITGANGFIGKNLTETLKNIRDGKDKTTALSVDALYLADIKTTPEELVSFTAQCDFVVHLAGVNRPNDNAEFMAGNRDFLQTVLQLLEQHGNTCPVLLSSSTQAALDNPYGKSKRAAEALLFEYGKRTGAKVLIYRFPNVFGKWCRPNYNSVIATFCYNIAHDLPITIHNRDTMLTLVPIDAVVNELLHALQGNEWKDGDYCAVRFPYTKTLGEIADLLYRFKQMAHQGFYFDLPAGSFEKCLYSTYLSYLPKERAVIDLPSNCDERGSFTELVHTATGGQFSVNVSKPGITKGQHWHHSKWELFIVVKGEALIQQRQIGSDEVLEYRVSGEKLQAVCMLPGYTHNIINLSDKDELITLMWANENFDRRKPDTYFEPVE